MPEQVEESKPQSGAEKTLLDRGRSLVLAAFNEARSSGRSDWDTMRTAVLKNRLLNSTRREFHEQEYGVNSISEFVRLFPDLLSVDFSTHPPLVKLIDIEALPALERDASAIHTPARTRIRPDLWRAIVDYQSGNTYVWDRVARIARVADPVDENPIIPTITSEIVARLRVRFAQSEQTSTVAKELLEEWLSNNYGSNFLPAPLRGRWNGFFRESILGTLTKFFSDNAIEQPADLILHESSEKPARRHLEPTRDDNLASLRQLVQQCVAVMSEKELTDLKISPTVVVRALRKRG
jgi:hypothetical protein